MENKKELLKPKIDVVFHSLFREGNEEITKAIITAVTKEKIEKIDLNNDRYVVGKYPEEKLGILDLKATLDDGVICNIEVQLADNKDTAERFLFYWSRNYSSQLVRGDKYNKLNKVIGIMILDYKFEKLREIEIMHTKWQIKETLTGKEITLTDLFELHIIEIPKAKKVLEQDATNELAQWMMFFNNPNEEEVSKIMEENKEIKKAMNELEEISQDEELRRVAELKEKAIFDEIMARNGLTEYGRKEGIKEIVKRLIYLQSSYEDILKITGLSDKKLQEIMKELKEISQDEELRRVAELKEKAIFDEIMAKNGLTEYGRKEGRKEERKEIVKRLSDLDYPNDEIIKITGLSEKELEEIMEEIDDSK